MQRFLVTLLLVIGVSLAGLAQTAKQRPDVPEGTTVKETHVEAVVEPKTKAVKVTPEVVRAAQVKLNAMGYDPGPAEGILGPRTRAAIEKFQADKDLNVTGRLDQTTLEKLNVGGTKVIGSAPADAGRGFKAAGHNIKKGHPIAATKAAGKGIGDFGKKVGKGAKSVVVGTKDKLVGTKSKEEQKQDKAKEQKPNQ
jgi:peptidoglycan hydrolase-like protein with peptidoglycan-binding domain